MFVAQELVQVFNREGRYQNQVSGLVSTAKLYQVNQSIKWWVDLVCSADLYHLLIDTYQIMCGVSYRAWVDNFFIL